MIPEFILLLLFFTVSCKAKGVCDESYKSVAKGKLILSGPQRNYWSDSKPTNSDTM